MARARWTALAVVAVLIAVGTAVSGCGSSEKGRDVRKVAFVAPFSDNEPDWTLQAKEVVAEWPRRLGVRVDIADASQSDDVRAVLEQVAREGNQLVFAHDSRYAEAAEAVAEQTKVPQLVWGERPNAPEGLVGQIHVEDKEGGYMAGVVTARSAYTRRIGIIVIADGSAWDTSTWNRMAGGFVAGARSIDPAVRITYAQVGEDGRATVRDVQEAAQRMLDRGTQMMFALGGAATVGALRAVEHTGDECQYVGVIGDKEKVNRLNYVLASVMYDTRPVFEQAMRDVRSGRFAERPYELTLRNGGIWLFKTGRTPADAYEAGLDAGRKIQRGTLQVPETPTRTAVEELLAGETPAG